MFDHLGWFILITVLIIFGTNFLGLVCNLLWNWDENKVIRYVYSGVIGALVSLYLQKGS